MASNYVEILPSEALTVISKLTRKRGLHIGTHFSGLDFWSIATANVTRACGGHRLQVFHSCDVSEHSLQVLRAYHGMTEASHAFIGEEGRWDDATVDELKKKHKAALAEYEKLGSGDRAAIDALGESFVLGCEEILGGAEAVLKSVDWCFKCGQECPVFDVDLPKVRSEGGVVGSLSSPICVDFSKQNQKRPGWLGSSYLSCCCWVEERRRRHLNGEEDFSLAENVPDHPMPQLFTRNIPHVLVLSLILDPTNFAVPNTRRRRLTLAVSLRMVPTKLPPSRFADYNSDARRAAGVVVVVSSDEENDDATLLELWQISSPYSLFNVRAHEKASGSVWFFASRQQVKSFYAPLRQRNGLSQHQGSPEDFLERSSKKHLQAFLSLFEPKDLVGTADLRQRPEFSGRPTLHLPCLLEHCHQLWSFTFARPLLNTIKTYGSHATFNLEKERHNKTTNKRGREAFAAL